MEYIIVIGFALLMAFPLIMIFFSQSQDVTDQLSMNQVREIGRKVINTAEKVYYLGEPSQTILKVYLPSHVDSFIVNGTTQEIVFKVKIESSLSDVVFRSDVPIYNSSLLPVSGIRFIKIRTVDGRVNITDA